MADEVGKEFGAGVALGDVVFGEDLVGEVGAGFEGEFFGEDEGVVAVEEDFGDLCRNGISWCLLYGLGGLTLGMMSVI